MLPKTLYACCRNHCNIVANLTALLLAKITARLVAGHTDVAENWQDWEPAEYIRNLTHPIAEKGFKADLDAMLWADACVLVLPCGRSAHTEAGWFAGKGLKTIVYMPEKQEPELMYKLFDGVVDNLEDLIRSF